jgi:hypothetical protein
MCPIGQVPLLHREYRSTDNDQANGKHPYVRSLIYSLYVRDSTVNSGRCNW